MPQVPTFADPQQQVRQEAMPNARVNVDASAEAFNAGASSKELGAAQLGAAGAVVDVFKEARKRADEAAHTEADTEASKLQTSIQVQISKMKGKDSFAAQDYAQKAWKEGIEKIRGSLNGPTQKLAFDRSSGGRFDSLNKSVQMHVAGEGMAFEHATNVAGIEQATTAAVINSGDDQIIGQNLVKAQEYVDRIAKAQGIPKDDPQYAALKDKLLSPLHKDVIQARITAGLDDAASEYFEKNKGQMSAPDILHTTSALENVEVIKQGRGMWDDISAKPGMKFTDGSLNVEKMREAVQEKMEESKMSDRRQEQVMKYVKARAAEENVDRHKAVAEHDRMFMNEALQMRKSGASYEQASDLIGRYGSDNYDQAIKSEALAKLWAPPSQSDPGTHIALWQGIQDGKIADKTIDQAMRDGKINVGDWFTLRKDLFNSKIAGTDPLTKSAWDRVQAMATEDIGSSDKEEFKKFMYDMHVSAQGKSPEEIIKIGQDKLKDRPGSGIFGSDWFADRTYKGDVKKLDEQNLAWGQLYQDVGKKEVGMIGQGILMDKKKSQYNMNDIDEFAKEFGGRDALKAGTPANQAINYLIEHNLPVVPKNIKWRMEKMKTAGNNEP